MNTYTEVPDTQEVFTCFFSFNILFILNRETERGGMIDTCNTISLMVKLHPCRWNQELEPRSLMGSLSLVDCYPALFSPFFFESRLLVSLFCD